MNFYVILLVLGLWYSRDFPVFRKVYRSPGRSQLVMMGHAYDINTREEEKWGLWIWGQLGAHRLSKNTKQWFKEEEEKGKQKYKTFKASLNAYFASWCFYGN